MTTKRTPLRRPPRTRFSPEAFSLFRRIQRVGPCTCPPTDWAGEYWGSSAHECPACKQWWELHGELWRCWPSVRPWFWPIVRHPDARCPYPEGHANIAEWQRKHDEAAARWREIETAMSEYVQQLRAQRASKLTTS